MTGIARPEMTPSQAVAELEPMLVDMLMRPRAASDDEIAQWLLLLQGIHRSTVAIETALFSYPSAGHPQPELRLRALVERLTEHRMTGCTFDADAVEGWIAALSGAEAEIEGLHRRLHLAEQEAEDRRVVMPVADASDVIEAAAAPGSNVVLLAPRERPFGDGSAA